MNNLPWDYSQALSEIKRLQDRIEALEAALRNLIQDIDTSNTPTSVNRARAVLDPASLLRQETTQGTAPSGSAGHGKDAGK